MKKLDEYLKVAEASVFLGISQNTLRKWADEGRIPVHVIAEALNPFNGSWKGHDLPNRSEHYFHSGYVDLITYLRTGWFVKENLGHITLDGEHLATRASRANVDHECFGLGKTLDLQVLAGIGAHPK